MIRNDPDCKAYPMFNEHGLGSGASYGGGKFKPFSG